MLVHVLISYDIDLQAQLGFGIMMWCMQVSMHGALLLMYMFVHACVCVHALTFVYELKNT